MNSLFAHEKLGMPVTEQHMTEIRQDIEAQQMADEMMKARLHLAVHRWLQRGRALLKSPDEHRPLPRLVRLRR
jgi:hypothetical protein